MNNQTSDAPCFKALSLAILQMSDKQMGRERAGCPDEPISDNDATGFNADGPMPNTAGCGRCKESEMTSLPVFCFL